MSGQYVSTLKGKIPQRAIRYLGGLPYAVTYSETIDWGGSDVSTIFNTPANRRGKIMSVDLYGWTEDVVATTQPSFIIGDGTDADAFVEIVTVADGSVEVSLNAADGSLVPGAIEIVPAGSTVVTAVTAALTAPAGISQFAITILYFE